MFRKLKADKDSFITNKIINGQRVVDANVGQAGTLALFKLHNESKLAGLTGTVQELSRILVHFNLDPLRSLTGTILDLNDSSFKANLKLRNVFSGKTLPSNFTVAVFPLSKSFDEGGGFDIGLFRDVGAVNFITASTNSIWNLSGANASGTLGASNIDIIEQGNIGSGLQSFVKTQTFAIGNEDLEIDISNLVSATLVNLLPDCGFRISFSGSQETDESTRFVKTFTSRHANDPALRPSIDVSFDDTIQDNHRNFFFDLTGTLFLKNFHFNQPSNILFNGQQITGTNCLALRIVSGSGSTYFEKIITGSQYAIGANFQSGVYFATFAVGTNETGSLRRQIDLAGSASFAEIWGSLNGAQGFLTSSFDIKTVDRTAFDDVSDQLNVSVKNNKGKYGRSEKVRFHVFVQSTLERISYSRLPFERKSKLYNDMHYQIVDANSGKIHIPFETDNGGTKLSVHDNGMYFDLYMEDLYVGRTYGIELKFTELGESLTFDIDKLGAVFTVV